jgi:phosphoglycolate phosphatase-like HAD superfamily hydrolase
MRLFILVLSMACVALYGYAMAGYAGYSFGHGRPDYIAWGLSMGTLCGATALYLWKNYMKETTPDMLIFDIDGVLIDTCDSFSSAAVETVRWCWENLLGGDADCEGYTMEYLKICKAYPAFNDDSFVAWALLCCMTRRRKRTGSKSMKGVLPSLKEWEKEVKAFNPAKEEETAELSQEKVGAVLEEFYYGEKAYAEYKGTPALGIGGEGLWIKENPGTSKNWKELGLPVGIYTGRTRGEIALAQRQLNWPDFPQDMMISSDDGILKPSPLGLSILCERAGAQHPLFFGDTASDKAAWAAFGKGDFVTIGPILKAQALREGSLYFDTLEEALAALL